MIRLCRSTPPPGQVMQVDCNRHRPRPATDACAEQRRCGQAFRGRYGNRSGHIQPTSALRDHAGCPVNQLCAKGGAESRTKRFPSTQKRSPSCTSVCRPCGNGPAAVGPQNGYQRLTEFRCGERGDLMERDRRAIGCRTILTRAETAGRRHAEQHSRRSARRGYRP